MWMDAVRTVHLDQRKIPADAAPAMLGYSIGRLDGDTLVIETADFTPGVLRQYAEETGKLGEALRGIGRFPLWRGAAIGVVSELCGIHSTIQSSLPTGAAAASHEPTGRVRVELSDRAADTAPARVGGFEPEPRTMAHYAWYV